MTAGDGTEASAFGTQVGPGAACRPEVGIAQGRPYSWQAQTVRPVVLPCIRCDLGEGRAGLRREHSAVLGECRLRLPLPFTAQNRLSRCTSCNLAAPLAGHGGSVGRLLWAEANRCFEKNTFKELHLRDDGQVEFFKHIERYLPPWERVLRGRTAPPQVYGRWK